MRRTYIFNIIYQFSFSLPIFALGDHCFIIFLSILYAYNYKCKTITSVILQYYYNCNYKSIV